MRVTSKGQVTIPQEVRKKMGIHPAETEVEFILDKDGRCYLKKLRSKKDRPSRFRTAYKAGKLRLGTDEIMKLTRG